MSEGRVVEAIVRNQASEVPLAREDTQVSMGKSVALRKSSPPSVVSSKCILINSDHPYLMQPPKATK